jgi:hypothetical protein
MKKQSMSCAVPPDIIPDRESLVAITTLRMSLSPLSIYYLKEKLRL